MFWRKKHEMMYDDDATNRLMNRGVYSLYKPDVAEKGRFSKRREHNIFMGMWYVFILSCLLWWLPLFGQMIAGYLGGRKAGSPTKGVFVAVIPVFIILLLFVGMDLGMLPSLGTIVGIPNMIMNGIQGFSPHAASYVSGMYISLRSFVGLDGNGFIIVVVFGLIGGMMADMNKKEIIRATGNEHFYDAFLGRLSGASLSKFADMVAERVIWTLGSIDHGGRNLLGRGHSEPNAFSFDELQKLPSTSTAYALPAHISEPTSYQPEKAFGYDAQSSQDEEFMHMENIAPKGSSATYRSREEPQDSLVQVESISPRRSSVKHRSRKIPEDSFMQMKKLNPKAPRPRSRSRKEPQDSLEEEWGISHRDLSEESLTKDWKEHKKNIDGGRYGGRYTRNAENAPERLYSKKKPKNQKPKEKRDALVYDNEGKLINKSKAQRNVRSKSSKNKVPSLVTRALDADKEIDAKTNENAPQTPPEKQRDEKTTRTKPGQSYERL